VRRYRARAGGPRPSRRAGGGERPRPQSSACPRNKRLVLYERPVPHALARVLGSLRECGTERGRRRTTAMMMGAAHTRRPGRRFGRSRPGGGADERRKRPSDLASGLGGRRICSFELEAGVLTMPLVGGGHRRPGSRIPFVSHIPPRNATTPREMEHRRHISHLNRACIPRLELRLKGGEGRLDQVYKYQSLFSWASDIIPHTPSEYPMIAFSL
jgi:hypothetical protein